jgi:hypothetical protein
MMIQLKVRNATEIPRYSDVQISTKAFDLLGRKSRDNYTMIMQIIFDK